MKCLKIVVVGDKGVGKTSMLISYTTNTFPTDDVPPLYDNFLATVPIDGKEVKIELCDTEGKECERLRPGVYPEASVLLIAFSLVDLVSFDHVETKWSPEVSHYCANIPVVLVGLKEDLRKDSGVVQKLAAKGECPVSCEQGVQMAQKIGAVKYLECSSMTPLGLKDVFDEVIRAVLNPRPAKQPRHSCFVL
uniref:Uncharacterized protein n=1 Tax=Arcella intermedia TaxID=1963864 RepID=A0A6B2LJN8_9EUKA|eukprot:TRINITY_DN13458_c0_g1_i1.p1 TRINITY_DN13458_c0_g1~~TRINITY_DN13458_c0_g1_i1.p1  ORF type:complete len:192 (-),score=50.29 TRINITY_DN13458_c0_g1_i1:29-604(-)